MRRLATIVTTAILPVGLILFGLTDLKTSVADTSIPDKKMTTSQAKASNSSAIATITITMTGILNE